MARMLFVLLGCLSCWTAVLGDVPSDHWIAEQLFYDNVNERISLSNSEVLIHNDGTERIVEKGRETFSGLLRIAESPDISFNMFTRTVSAASQIAGKCGCQTKIHWYGSAKVDNGTVERNVLLPLGQHKLQAFRAEILEQMRLISKELKDQPATMQD